MMLVVAGHAPTSLPFASFLAWCTIDHRSIGGRRLANNDDDGKMIRPSKTQDERKFLISIITLSFADT
jgi:hypothetical protein